MLVFIFFLTFIKFSSTQKIIPLNIFKGGNVDNKIDATPPYSLYVSAHMDTSIVLNQILLKRDDNQVKTIEELKNAKLSNISGQLTPLKVNSDAYISSSLSDNQMGALEGFLYITTAKQSIDWDFKVFDVDQSQMIRTSLLLCDPCTIVLLNTNTIITPVQSSTISFWRQSADSVVSMYKGVPTDDEESDDSQIFSNPMQSFNNQQIRFTTVEQFSVTLGAFYMKSTKDFYFAIQPSYLSLDQYAMTGYTSTGFYMKSKTQQPANVTLYCVRDTRFNGTTGANFLGSLPDPDGIVVVEEWDRTQNESLTVHPFTKINKMSTNRIGETLSIYSVKSDGGEYFVQYYIQQDQEISVTFGPTDDSRTTRSMESTTKVSNGVSWFLSMIVVSVLL